MKLKYKILIIISIISVFIIGGLWGIGQSKGAEPVKAEVAFFTIPVHVVLPNDNYVASYTVETNEKVSLRSMLAFHNIVTFFGDEMHSIHHYDTDQKLVESFIATAEQPFYIRVMAQDQTVLAPTTMLPVNYLATDGLSVVIQQPLVDFELGTMEFLTEAELKQSIQTKSVQLIDRDGYYDEAGNWISFSNDFVVEEEIEEVDPVICLDTEELVDGSCQAILEPEPEPESEPEIEQTPPSVVTPEPTPSVPVCGSNEELVNGACQAKPPVCGSNEELVNGVCQTKPPVCGSNEELVNGVCQTKPPVCNDNEILVDGVCQVTPSEEDEVPDNQNPSETLDENDDVLDTENKDENQV
ncbi:MAG: hypothetical protein ACRDCC_10400 [Culicoidibacterales bacterium]